MLYLSTSIHHRSQTNTGSILTGVYLKLIFSCLLLPEIYGQIIIKRNETKQLSPCPLPQQPLNGRFRIRRQGGVSAIFTCNSGYLLSGHNVSRCIEKTKLWSHFPPTCVTAQKVPESQNYKRCDEVSFEPQTVFLNDGAVTLRCHTVNGNILWLKDSVALSYVVPGITLTRDGSLVLTSKDLVGHYTCLSITANSLRVLESYMVVTSSSPNIPLTVTHNVEIHPLKPKEVLVITVDKSIEQNRLCGVPQLIFEPETKIRKKRIIDGTRAKLGSAPWMGIMASDKNPFLCGCSLLNSNWVVTAAHCLNSVEDHERSKLVIKLGKYLRRQREPGQFTSSVSRIAVHPDFRPRTIRNGKIIVNSNDIALLKLETPVPAESNSIIPICLPREGLMTSLPESALAVVTGWGRVSVQQSINAYTLQEAKLPLVNRGICESSSDYALANGTLCAGYAESYKPDTCDGDSGGPLSVKVNDRSFLIGIVSWGQGCSSPGKYGIYTDVEKYLSWILNLINSNE